ncbi:ABC transporter substrate-binding protein [Pseudonocardia sichuanensis]
MSRREVLRRGGLLFAGAAGASLLPACGSDGSGALTLWWAEGFLRSETEAVQKLVADWEQATGNKADLQIYPNDAIATKAQSAIQIGRPPDILFTDGVPHSHFAQQGLLADVTEIVSKLDLTPGAKRGAQLYNAEADRTSYYVTPVAQKTPMLFYWRSELEKAGLSADEIPSDWTGFWDFWKQAQPAYRGATGQDAYSFGWPLSTGNTDVYEDFRRVLMAYDVQLINQEDARLNAADPAVRDGLIESVNWLTDLYKDGYIPPDAVSWLSGDNNTSFLNKSVLLTPNATLSIPMAIRESDPDAWPDVVTANWPDRAVGGPMPPMVEVVPLMLFTTPNEPVAKDFLAFFTAPENMAPWVAAQGRNIPTYQSLLQQPEWADSQDPNVRSVVQAMSIGGDELAWKDISPEYHRMIESQSLWGEVLGKVASGNQSAPEAVDFALNALEQAFSESA